MDILVIHNETPVAKVAVKDSLITMEALEVAYRLTQNLEGSWSMGEYIDGKLNPDWHPAVEVLQPLEVIKGQEWGHRSSMIGDVFLVDGREYQVDTFGFKRIN